MFGVFLDFVVDVVINDCGVDGIGDVDDRKGDIESNFRYGGFSGE